jgi:hypothetical protein
MLHDTSDNVAYTRSDDPTMKQREVKTRDNVAYTSSDGLTRKQREVKTRDNVAYGLHTIGQQT